VGREKATGADVLPMAFRFLAAWVGVWVARQQADQIEYLKTVNPCWLPWSSVRKHGRT
jgi:hypothetical protein